MLRLAFLIAGFIPYLVAAWQDASRRIIANEVSIIIAVLGLLRLVMHRDLFFAGATVLASCVAFGITLLLFSRRWLGGGDVKLITASVLLVGCRDAAEFGFLMTFAGAVLGLGLWVAGRFRVANGAVTEPVTVPYGVAIAFGAGCVLVKQYLEGFI